MTAITAFFFSFFRVFLFSVSFFYILCCLLVKVLSWKSRRSNSSLQLWLFLFQIIVCVTFLPNRICDAHYRGNLWRTKWRMSLSCSSRAQSDMSFLALCNLYFIVYNGDSMWSTWSFLWKIWKAACQSSVWWILFCRRLLRFKSRRRWKAILPGSWLQSRPCWM